MTESNESNLNLITYIQRKALKYKEQGKCDFSGNFYIDPALDPYENLFGAIYSLALQDYVNPTSVTPGCNPFPSKKELVESAENLIFG